MSHAPGAAHGRVSWFGLLLAAALAGLAVAGTPLLAPFHIRNSGHG